MRLLRVFAFHDKMHAICDSLSPLLMALCQNPTIQRTAAAYKIKKIKYFEKSETFYKTAASIRA